MTDAKPRERLAFFMPSLGCGGVERVLLRLASGFADLGFAVDLIVADAEGPSDDGSFRAHVPDNVRVVDLGRSRVALALPGLASYLRRERPAALLSAMEHCNLVALWAKLLARVETRVVVSLHSTENRAVEAITLKRRIIRSLMRRSLRYAHAIVAVSQGVADDYARFMDLPRSTLRVVYNPVVAPEIFRHAEEEPKHPWFAQRTSPLVLSVGRLAAAKNYPILIEAMKAVHARTGARLVILGEGSERPRLTAEISRAGLDRVIDLPGYSDNPYSHMRSAEVLVLCSSSEGLPTVLVEAMALGTPIVSTDCPSGPAEILEGGKWGRLVAVDDAAALALAIEDTLSQPRRGAAVERADAFSVKNILREYADVLSISI